MEERYVWKTRLYYKLVSGCEISGKAYDELIEVLDKADRGHWMALDGSISKILGIDSIKSIMMFAERDGKIAIVTEGVLPVVIERAVLLPYEEFAEIVMSA